MNQVLAAILPVFLVAATGYGFRRAVHIDIRSLASLNIYLFIPALVFSSLSQRDLEWALFGQIAVASVLRVLLALAVWWAVAQARGYDRTFRSAFYLTIFVNTGNFGLPVSKFGFGEEGLAMAVVVMVCCSLAQNSGAVYLVRRDEHGVLKALGKVLTFPMIYAFILALVFQRLPVQPPVIVGRAITILAGAAIPVQLIILGGQLAESRLESGADVFLATGLKLVAGPLLAALTVYIVGLEGLAAKVFILQLSGPVAVTMAVYGVKFAVYPRFVASVVSWSFLLSLFSVSVVLYILYRVTI